MSSRSFVYIAAPFGPDPNSTLPVNDQIRLNVARACALGRLAIAMDLVPEVPHVSVGALFAYADTDPKAREKSLELGLTRLKVFIAASREMYNGDFQFWLLTRDDGSVSSGCAAELKMTQDWDVPDGKIWQTSWHSARGEFEIYGLLGLWYDPLLALPEMLPASSTHGCEDGHGYLTWQGDEECPACSALAEMQYAYDENSFSLERRLEMEQRRSQRVEADARRDAVDAAWKLREADRRTRRGW